MASVTCPACGSVYPLTAETRGRFACVVCREEIPLRASAWRPRRAGGWPLVFAVTAVCAAAVVAAALAFTPDPVADRPATAPMPSSAVEPSTPAPWRPSDPDADPDAWKALSSGDRARRASVYLARLDRSNAAALLGVHAFLRARGEDDAARQVIGIELARDPESPWAHRARGETRVDTAVDRCLAECNRAEEAETDAVQRLGRFVAARKPSEGAWWVDATTQRELASLLDAVRADEKRLGSPAEWAVARAILRQRRLDVMREYAFLTARSGPYLVVAQSTAPATADPEKVDAVERERLQATLARTSALLASLDEAFHATFGASLGLERHGATDVDESALRKVDLLPDAETYGLWRSRVGLTDGAGLRASYRTEEPRYVVTYDDASPDGQRALAREAVRQLLHFASWDVTRRRDGHEPAWVQSAARPPWLDTGVATFFASHRMVDRQFAWIEPDDDALRDVWLSQEIARRLRWADWTLDELLGAENADQVAEHAAQRVAMLRGQKIDDAKSREIAFARRLFLPAFDGKCWGLVSFLWNAADESGRPRWRNAFVSLLAQSLRVSLVRDAAGALRPRILGVADFRRALSLENDDQWLAFEREWRTWERQQTSAAHRPDWDVARDRLLAEGGLRDR
jgi:hypothetical protein